MEINEIEEEKKEIHWGGCKIEFEGFGCFEKQKGKKVLDEMGISRKRQKETQFKRDLHFCPLDLNFLGYPLAFKFKLKASLFVFNSFSFQIWTQM